MPTIQPIVQAVSEWYLRQHRHQYQYQYQCSNMQQNQKILLDAETRGHCRYICSCVGPCVYLSVLLRVSRVDFSALLPRQRYRESIVLFIPPPLANQRY